MRKHIGSVLRGVGALLCLLPSWLHAETMVVGQVTDKDTGLPLAAVHVYFRHDATQGTTTNDEGYFFLSTPDDGERLRLVFSSMGYAQETMRVKGGETAYATVALQEQNTLLEDVLIVPGTNPALDWMKRIRLARRANDLTARPDYSAAAVEQSLVLLSRADGAQGHRRLFDQLRQGNLSPQDSTLVIPLYMAESRYDLSRSGRAETSKEVFTSSAEADRFVVQLLQGLEPRLNFYDNAVQVLGKSIVSPLASIGNTYYKYYLADSLATAQGKEYVIRFRTKNPKNLAFDGSLRFDSASLALTAIEASLPRQAAINYVRGLSVRQRFEPAGDGRWVQRDGTLSMSLAYEVVDAASPRPTSLLIRQSTDLSTEALPAAATDSFARSDYSVATLEERMQALEDTPLMRTAKWIADAAITSEARFGCIDFGPLPGVLRLTDEEGLRLAIPLRTNERLWRNVSIGGYAGYGFRSHKVNFSAFGKVRLPAKRRHVLELRYTDDNRRVDYDYNSYQRREDPWDTGDEDIITSLLSFTSGHKISPRREWLFSYATDWTRDIESTLYLRAHRYLPATFMPMAVGGTPLTGLRQQSATVATRFSWGARKYDDHLNRFYVTTNSPVVYAIVEGGRYRLEGADGRTGGYAKLIASVKQRVTTPVGDWNYLVEGGWLLGSVPYPLLEYSPGNEPNGIGLYQCNLMKFMEFGHDKYVQVNNEFVFNGLLFNLIPGVKLLNLREFVAVKTVVGGLSGRHREVMDFPDLPHCLHPMRQPYVEGSVGVTNFLGIFSFQYNYRFTNHYEGVRRGGFTFGLRFGF